MNQVSADSHLLRSTKAECDHCGEHCIDDKVILEDKVFCCEGCKMVYAILQENGMGKYYELNEVAGISQKGKSEKWYAYLDDPEVIHKLISFQSERNSRVIFYIPQIHCSSCLWLLENLPLLHEGILNSRVDFLKKEASISFDPKQINLREVVELMARIGYAPHIQLNDLDAKNRPITDKSLYYKLGLAGFVFGNIMLFSFPEYLGLSDDPTAGFNKFFGYLSFALILPVLFYSGSDYFRSAWQGLKRRHLNIDVPVSLGIAALFLRSSYEIFFLAEAGYLDSLSGLIFFLLIGKWFQQTTYARIAFDRDFKSYFPIACTIRKEGQEQQVSLDKLELNNIVLIRHGELIPTDAVLLKGDAQMDYSFVTGESRPVNVQKGELLYAGGRQIGGLIEIQVVKKVSNSYLTQLWNDHAFDKSNSKGTANVIADKVASLFTWAILLVAFSTLFYWLPRDTHLAINAFTAVLIIACPCAVALSIPFTFGNVVRLFARQGIYFKNIQVIESLAKINHVVFDKTGTLTNIESTQLEYSGIPLSMEQKEWIHSLASQSTHPLSRLVAEHLSTSIGIDHKQTGREEVEDLEEKKGLGITGKIAGNQISLGSKQFINSKVQEFSSGLSGVHLAIDETYFGVFQSNTAYRKGVKNVIDQLQSWADLSLLSGDNNQEESKLTPMFGHADQLHFEQKPKQKLQHIRGLQKEADQVAMIGDGLNDAGALQQSEVGIVITENTSNFTPACDIIMDAKQFEKIPLLFSFARGSIRLVYIAYAIALLYNIIGLSYAVQGNLSPVIAAILMPLSSVSIVLFGVGMSTFLAWRNGLFSEKNEIIVHPIQPQNNR